MTPRPEWMRLCSIDCERMPECSVCRKTKAPVGRDVPAACWGSYCNDECVGYRETPTPGHLWPGELADADKDDNDGN